MTRSSENTVTGPRIVMQYWRGDVRVCELENAGDTLDVHISRCEERGNQEWTVEVRNGRTATPVALAERGTTRTSALLAAASSWRARGTELGLRVWDWDAVARALKAVQAID